MKPGKYDCRVFYVFVFYNYPLLLSNKAIIINPK